MTIFAFVAGMMPAAAQAPVGEVIKLTAPEAVRMAIENNLDLATGKYDPGISAERVAQARAAFLPTVLSGVQRNVQQSPPSSVFFGTQGIRTDIWSGNVGLGQRLPWGGGSYNLAWTSNRTNATSSLSNFNPAVVAQLQASVDQPLLRDFRIDPFRAQLTTAQRNREIADIDLQELAVATSASAERAYWNLVLAIANVGVQQRSLELSQELERTNRARVDVGQSPPLDLVSAQAEVAQRRENLIVARTLVRQAEDQLRLLIIDSKRPDYWSVHLQPADLVPPVGPPPDVDGAVRVALQQRTDLIRTRKEIQNTDTAIALAKSDVLPDLRLQATYQTNGLGGTELLRNGLFGPVIGQNYTAYGDVLRQIFAANYPTWTVGFTLRYPLGKSAEQATLARSSLEREQSLARLRSAEYRAVREIRLAAMQLDQNRERIGTTRVARELSEQRLDAEQKRFEVGMSTNFNVIQAQRDLAVARNNELNAQLDYQRALIAFETVQKISAGSTPDVVNGTTTPPATSTTPVTTAAGPGGLE